jgi:trimethylamine---corrinoid protein Co-methyltransferase
MINTGLAPQATPEFRILSRSQIEAIHDASMRILAQTGVRVYNDEAIGLLRDAGAFVEADGLVKIPAHLIDWAVRVSPGNITIHDRNGSEAMRLGRRRTYFGTGSDTPNVIDPYTGARRRALLADVGAFARVCDALARIDFVMCMGIASDRDPATAELDHFLAMLRNTTKPIVYTALDLEAAGKLLQMASLVAGGEDAFRQRPFAIMYIEPVSPLGFSPEVMQKLLFCAEHGIPCIFMSGMLSGGTGPITSAGSLALANAESLAGVLIAQLKRKGTPVISGGGILTLDMRSAISSYGAPEFMLTMAAISEMAEYYDLPAWGYAGCTDAKVFDEQAAADTAEWVMMAALSGSNLVHDVGFVESGLASSFDQLVFADEVIGKCAYLLNGMTVDEETLAVDVTHDVGPGGQFLNHRHTAKHFRANWSPELEDRQNYGNWEKQGSLAMRDRVNAKVRDLIENHQPEPLHGDLDAQLSRLVASPNDAPAG